MRLWASLSLSLSLIPIPSVVWERDYLSLSWHMQSYVHCTSPAARNLNHSYKTRGMHDIVGEPEQDMCSRVQHIAQVLQQGTWFTNYKTRRMHDIVGQAWGSTNAEHGAYCMHVRLTQAAWQARHADWTVNQSASLAGTSHRLNCESVCQPKHVTQTELWISLPA